MERTDWKAGIERWWPVAVFTLLLALHVVLATRNFSSGFLVGHEFRQTQTAISAYFIQQEGNYSLAYPTPVLGKPWAVPFEFPLYQWSVAKLSSITGWPIHVSGRLLSLLGFYLALPALWRLLAEAGVERRGRWLVLGVVVTAPLHIFYSRAVLIESFALAFALWFLAAFCHWMRTRSPGWLVVAALCGAGAVLVKVTTGLVWLAVASGITLWGARAALGQGIFAAIVVLTRAAAAAALPVAAGWAWVRYADAIKALSPGARGLRSSSLSHLTFGRISDRVDPSKISQIFENWNTAVSPIWLCASIIATALVVNRRHGWAIALGVGATIAGPAAFIWLYATHDYYFYGTACGVLVAVGLAIVALEAQPRWRTVGAVAFLILCGSQLASYARHYAALQTVPSNGGSNLTDVIRDVTPREGVMIIAGDDWAPVTPYYSRRRALMIPTERLGEESYLQEAFAQLSGEQVMLLVLRGPQRTNDAFRQLVIDHFQLSHEIVISDDYHDVYASPQVHDALCLHLERYRNYGTVVLRGKKSASAQPLPAPPKRFPLIVDNSPHDVLPEQREEFLGLVLPAPHRYSCRFGFGAGQLGEQTVLGAHPDSALWLRIPTRATTVTFGFGLMPATYQAGSESTDGVRFEIVLQPPVGPAQVLFQRDLRPASVPADQGTQTLTVDLPARATGELVFRTSPLETLTRDWAYWSKIEVR